VVFERKNRITRITGAHGILFISTLFPELYNHTSRAGIKITPAFSLETGRYQHRKFLLLEHRYHFVIIGNTESDD